jgi:predicted dehydrogenase
MKFLVIGLGSMGKRRIRNLLVLGQSDVIGFDIRQDRIKEAAKLGIQTFPTIEDALKQKPDAVIISTSPNIHIKYVQKIINLKIPFFTEVNTEPEDIKKIILLSKKNKVLAISSMTMKFHPVSDIVRKCIKKGKLGKALVLNYHSGENLEDWHPWERVQDYYVGHISTGGGRDQAVFELEWILWLFGKPIEVMAKTEKLSKTKAKIFDMYQMTISLSKIPVANILVDVIQRPPNRILKIIFENGIIEWNWIQGLIRIYNSNTKKWEEYGHGSGYKGFNVEEMYQNEISEFIKSIKQNKNLIHSFEDELVAAKTIVAAEKSSKQKKTILLKI